MGVLVKQKYIFAIVALAFSASALATDRTEKIRGLMEAQGLNSTFDQMIQSGREQGRKQANEMLAQLLAGLNPSDEFKQQFQVAVGKFLGDLQPPWGSKEIVEIWSQFYGPNFTDEELDQLLAFYTSSLAQKEVVSSRRALVEFIASFEAKYKPIRDRATESYIQNLRAIVRDCKCGK